MFGSPRSPPPLVSLGTWEIVFYRIYRNVISKWCCDYIVTICYNHVYNYHVCFVLFGGDNFMHIRLGSSTWAKQTLETDLRNGPFILVLKRDSRNLPRSTHPVEQTGERYAWGPHPGLGMLFFNRPVWFRMCFLINQLDILWTDSLICPDPRCSYCTYYPINCSMLYPIKSLCPIDFAREQLHYWRFV